MRGTEGARHEQKRSMRITPACAGNRYSCLFIKTFSRDHPRVCGEQPNYPLAPNPVKGSPPRVRGTVLCILRSDFRERITPACAGNSFPPAFMGAAGGDHPRVCGEQFGGSSWKWCMSGSPPRVRGTAQPFGAAHPFCRITPACAGNSNIFVKHIDKT